MEHHGNFMKFMEHLRNLRHDQPLWLPLVISLIVQTVYFIISLYGAFPYIEEGYAVCTRYEEVYLRILRKHVLLKFNDLYCEVSDDMYYKVIVIIPFFRLPFLITYLIREVLKN